MAIVWPHFGTHWLVILLDWLRRGPDLTGPAPGFAVAGLQLGGDRLDLGIGLEDLVPHLPAPAGLLVSAERQGRVEHVVAVDPHRAGPQLLGQRVRLGD